MNQGERMSRHCIAITVLTAVICLTSQGEEKSYWVKFDRHSVVGDAVDMSITATNRSTTITKSTTQPARSQIREITVFLVGRGQTLALDPAGNESKTSFTIKDAKVTLDGQTYDILPKGTVLAIAWQDGKTVYSVAGVRVADSVASMLQNAPMLRDPRLPGNDENYRNDLPRKVDESWSADPEVIVKSLALRDMQVAPENIAGTSTLSGVETIDGTNCLHVSIRLDAKHLDFKSPDGSITRDVAGCSLTHLLIPADEHVLHELTTSEATRFTFETRSTASAQGPKETKRTILEWEFSEKLRPVQKE
jgi:hypothetical protein